MAQSRLLVTDAGGNAQSIETTVLPDGYQSANQIITDESGNRVKADAQNNMGVQNGGRSASYNLTAAVAIKATAGRLRKIVVQAPGSTGGAFTFNDCATTGAAAAGNQIWTIPYNGAANVAGAIFELNWPCATGITLSAVPTGGSPIVAVSYD